MKPTQLQLEQKLIGFNLKHAPFFGKALNNRKERRGLAAMKRKGKLEYNSMGG